MSPPWMPFYVADYLAATRRLSTLEHGAYMLLIMEYWQHGSLPSADHRLARIVQLSDRDWAKVRPILRSFFDDNWRHKRIDAELAKSTVKNESRIAAGREGGLAKQRRRLEASNATIMLEAKQQQKSTDALASSSQPQSFLQKDISDEFHSSSSTPVGADVPTLEKPIKAKRVKPDDEELIQDIAALWNDNAASMGLTQIRDIPDRRISAIRARCRDFPTFGIDDPRAGFQQLIAKVRGSPFLLGQSGPWRADFDFVVSQRGFTKIMEGAYEAQGKPNGFAPGRH